MNHSLIPIIGTLIFGRPARSTMKIRHTRSHRTICASRTEALFLKLTIIRGKYPPTLLPESIRKAIMIFYTAGLRSPRAFPMRKGHGLLYGFSHPTPLPTPATARKEPTGKAVVIVMLGPIQGRLISWNMLDSSQATYTGLCTPEQITG